MLNLNVTISGDKVMIRGLGEFSRELPGAVNKGLKKIVRGVHPLAMAFLNGSGGAGREARLTGPTKGSRGFTKKSGEEVTFKVFRGAGGYPVPVRTGNLKRLLDWVDPGQSITSNGVTFSAGNMEAVIFDSAGYAKPIHEGTGSSRKFGPRRFLTDALHRFNSDDGIAKTINNEIVDLAQRKGLK